MNRVTVSIRTRRLPWRSWGIEICQPWIFSAHGRKGAASRRFASISRAGEGRESYEVRCGSSGNVTVDIHNAEALKTPLTPLILYFPPTGAHDKDEHPPMPKFLYNLPFQAALAQINYRWNIPPLSNDSSGDNGLSSPFGPLSTAVGYANHPFPIPLHDTLFAHDFLTATYLPTFHPPNPSNSSPRKPPQRPLILAGTFLGGTLATSLALTSTYASTTSRSYKIVALVAKDAVFDWTGIAVSQWQGESQNESVSQNPPSTNPQTEIERPGERGWTEETLHVLKKALFSSPQNAFDNFASPILFFRTPGFVVPKVWAGDESTATTVEANRYSTAIDPSIAHSIEEDEEVSTSYGEIVAANPVSGPTESTEVGSEKAPEMGNEVSENEKVGLGPQTARISYLKFPPTSSPVRSSSFSRYANANPNSELPQLKIPRTLFLYSKGSGDGGEDLEILEEGNKGGKAGKKRKEKPVKKEGLKKSMMIMGEEINPETQAKEMARVMRRSVLLVECKDRAVWDEGFDANGVASERAKAMDIGNDDDDGEDGGEDENRKVREWLEDSLG